MKTTFGVQSYVFTELVKEGKTLYYIKDGKKIHVKKNLQSGDL